MVLRKSKQFLGFVAIFLACLSFSFMIGSLAFIPHDSSAESSETVLDVELISVITMTVSPSTIVLNINPTPLGAEASDELEVNVSSNNLTGYTLTMNSRTANNALVNGNSIADTVPSIINLVRDVAEALPMNTWGYNVGPAISTSTFLTIPTPTSTVTLKTTSAPTANDAITLTIGAKADSSIPSGHYVSTLEFSAVPNFVPTPAVIPPLHSYPDNINPTDNPAALDVYPTTGWRGDVVVITSDELFTDVSNVMIGGTKCPKYSVISPSVIACELPSNAHGSTNDIEVISGGINVTPASTYEHMKITYFNPTKNTVSFEDTTTFSAETFAYYPSTDSSTTFSSTDCTNLVPNNTSDVDIPESLVFVRDTRNNQVYKVKKMADDKCWMIDNLKYIGNTNQDGNVITNVDSTSGIIFRNGEGPNGTPSSPIGNDTSWNTVSGSDTQNTTNSDKAFWNNPMSHIGCYDGIASGNIAANTLTHCGYMYNWYAATGGTGTYSITTNGIQATGSICPANFRLPSSLSGAGGPTVDGTISTVADFPVLNASMAAGSLATGNQTDDGTTQPNWLPTGPWSGTISGWWGTNLDHIGTSGWFRSSTNGIAVGSTWNLYFVPSTPLLAPGNDNSAKYWGGPVRCLLP